uniref:GPI anchored protein n=1 Tax=Mycena chlorophos TaxID=658473 RepID=A0ABQ0LU66_MYCCL|nr:predicted protein [Mycena chlorophos]
MLPFAVILGTGLLAALTSSYVVTVNAQTIYGVSLYSAEASAQASEPFTFVEDVTVSYSPVGTGSGVTTYLEDVCVTYEADVAATTTAVAVSPGETSTFSVIFAESSAGFQASEVVPKPTVTSEAGLGYVETCTFVKNADGQAVCMDVVLVNDGATTTTTFSGTVVPVFTISQGGTTSAQGASTASSAQTTISSNSGGGRAIPYSVTGVYTATLLTMVLGWVIAAM